jgi:S-adenosylmethionine synthetase
MLVPENLVIRAREGRTPGSLPVEVVERKGLGHPDTLCDAVAERISVRLCRHYLDRFGTILHHNVDKVLLCGGASRPSFGGGEIITPIEIYLSGRATRHWRNQAILVDEIAVDACKEILKERVPEIDIDEHVRITSRIRAGSTDLTHLFGKGDGVPRANDTSCGTGFAPLTDLERVVLAVERQLNDPEIKRKRPAIGSDIKVMGVRRGDHISLTVGCAFIGRHLSSIDAYQAEKQAVLALVVEAAGNVTKRRVDAVVNAADDVAAGAVFLTVIGTSAEAGDDGEVGRGNRTGGLITPYRSMTMEASAGKNPVSHVGKLYNVLADRIAGGLVRDVPGVGGASCLLVSQIGRPVDEPQVVDIELVLENAVRAEDVRAPIEREVTEQLGKMVALREELLRERVALY